MIKKDYYGKTQENHLFRRKKQEKGSGTLRSKISLIFLFLAILAWFGFIFYIPYFTISNFDFTGTDQPLAEKLTIALKGEFDSHKFFVLNRSNYFVFNETKFREKLSEMFILSNLEISKKFPNIIAINAKEKTRSLALIANNEAYFIDYKGMVIDVLKNTEKSYIPDTSRSSGTCEKTMENTSGSSDTCIPQKIVISDSITSQMPQVMIKNTSNAINARISVFNELQVSTIIEIYEKLNTEGMATDIIDLETPEDTKITVKTKEGFLIYLTTEDTIENQIENLKIVLKEKIGENRVNLQYIDLRFGDKVYFK